ncbi:Ankyrin-1 [Durusdinium trenchii]|uniref:Ankyrin-1 n=1 Tax=Durusdinium trenchii TaxID=1381693 RepID=A0ABP0J672_9DINO
MGKRGKRAPPAREAAQAFWACAARKLQGNGLRRPKEESVLHRLDDAQETPRLAPLPERFDSPGTYYARGLEPRSRRGRADGHINPAHVYGFDPLTPQELGTFRMQGQVLANAHMAAAGIHVPPAAAAAPVAAPAPAAPLPGALGAVAAAPAAPVGVAGAAVGAVVERVDTWIALEEAGPYKKGDVVARDPTALPAGSVQVGDRGVVPAGAGSILVKKVKPSEAASYRMEDLRVLPVKFDAQGIRRQEFPAAVSLMDDAEPSGGGLQLTGPPTALKILKDLRDQAFTPSTFHEHWMQSSDIPKGDRSTYEHECLSRILESMVMVDQLNAPALQSAELVCRRLQVIREAHRISPGQPDYSASDVMMGWKYRRSGQGIDSTLAAHVANELKAEAAIAKEARKAREEQAARRKGRAPKKGAAEGVEAHCMSTENSKLHGEALGHDDRWRELFPLPLCPEVPRKVATTVRPYDRGLLSIPSCGNQAVVLDDVLDDVGCETIRDPHRCMLLDEEEIGVMMEQNKPVDIYMDPLLKNNMGMYCNFVHDLFEAGMLDFTVRPRGLVTPFFVAKKSGKLRLILDCRETNRLFRRPPVLAAGTGASWSQIRIPDGEQLYVAQSDIKDYFYSLQLPSELRTLFCLPPIPGALLRHWKVNAEHCGSLDTDDWVHPMLRVVPMGWSWAMWLSQRVHQHQSQLGAGVSPDRVLVDGKPAPRLENGEVLLLPYADNLNVCGINAEAVQRAKDGAVARLRQVGLTVHEEMDANNISQSLGYMIDGSVGQVTPIPDRLHRVQLAFKWLSRRPRVTGKAVQRLLGHAVHFMMLKRELLSIPRHLYAFVQQANGRCRLWCSAAVEARWIGELLPLCATDLRKQTSALLSASDASLSGIAVCTRTLDEQTVRAIGSYRERWRFKGRNPANRPRQTALEGLDPFVDVASVKPVGPVVEDPFELDNQFPDVPKALLDNTDWSLRFSQRMVYSEHITLLEGRGIVASLRHKFRSTGQFHQHHVHLSDNLGMVLAVDKGAGNISGQGKLLPVAVPCKSKQKRKPVQVGLSSRQALRSQLQGNNKEERAEKRQIYKQAVSKIPRFQGQTFLEMNAISEEVASDYRIRMSRFRAYAKLEQISLRCQKNLDSALSAYLNEMFEDGEDIGEATKTLAAVVDSVPECTQKGSLPRSRRCLQGWNRLDPGATRPPIPWELVAAIVNYMLARQQINEGLLVLLMFDAYLRPGEAISLHRQDLVEPTVQHPVFCLNLNPSERGASSKMGLSDETIVLDGKETPWMGLLLRRHLETHKSQKLFPIEYRQLKDAWQKALVGVQLSNKHCVLYQLRHSGPSHDRMTKARSLVEIKKRGRWLSDSSVRRYEAAARLNQEFQKLPRAVQTKALAAPQLLQQWASLDFVDYCQYGVPWRKNTGFLHAGIPNLAGKLKLCTVVNGFLALILSEARASASNAWWSGGSRARGSRWGKGSVSGLAWSTVKKVAKERGVNQKLLSLKVNVPEARPEWPTFRTAWLFELRLPRLPEKAALFFVERAAPGRQDLRVDLCGFPPAAWGWNEQTPFGSAMVPVELRPLEDLVPLLRMWTACFLAPQVPFLHQLLGAKSASHRVFSDSEDDAATADAAADATADAAADATADESAESAESAESDGMSPSLDSLNLLQKEAVTKILSGGLLRRCHLLQGPPGTGKTRAVVALLQQLSLQRADLDNRILVSAPSNGAVQVALEHFLKTEEAQRTSLCLAGVDERVPSEGPLRAAFIHTRMQYTLALLLKCEKDPTALPEAVQVRIAGVQRSIRVRSG